MANLFRSRSAMKPEKSSRGKRNLAGERPQDAAPSRINNEHAGALQNIERPLEKRQSVYRDYVFVTMETNSRASRVSSGQLTSLKIDCLTSNDPSPTASQPAFRNSPTSSGLAMPVGIMRKCGSGARSALI